ncbi:hypothetical protein JYU19_00160 [bacterium AH-315-J21]|nr:hypothetical protein [bacterium AH-315-J21]
MRNLVSSLLSSLTVSSLTILSLILFIPAEAQDKTDGSRITRNNNKTTTYGAGDIVTCGLLDNAGNLWFGTTTEGAYRYDGKSFSRFTELEGLCNNEIWSILEDKDGVIWFGTADGLCSYDGENFTHVPIPWNGKDDLWGDMCNPNVVMSMLEDRNGFLWLGTCGGGAYRYDGNTFINFTSNADQLQSDSLHHNVIKSMLEDTDGNIWFTSLTHGGVSRYDGESFTHFTSKDGLNDDMVFASLQDKTGNIWFGCIQTKGGGLYRYDGKTFINYSKADGLCDNFVMSLFEDKTGKLWIGTGSGICIYDPLDSLREDGKMFAPFLPAKEDQFPGEIRFFIEDRDDNIWFGGRYGILYRYDGKILTDFTY